MDNPWTIKWWFVDNYGYIVIQSTAKSIDSWWDIDGLLMAILIVGWWFFWMQAHDILNMTCRDPSVRSYVGLSENRVPLVQ